MPLRLTISSEVPTSPEAGPRLVALSQDPSQKHMPSWSLLVAGVKGPLYHHRRNLMNSGLKKGVVFPQ